MSFELAGERPTLVADLRSEQLDFDDLGVLVGAPHGPGRDRVRGAEAGGGRGGGRALRACRTRPFDVPDLRAIDARVKFEGESVQAKMLPLERMSLELTLKDGRLTIEPLRFDLADGELESIMSLDSESDALDGEIRS